jgi:hypothetical protein
MPAQRKITQAEYIALADSYAQAIEAMATAIGDEDTPGTAAYYAAAARAYVTAWEDPDEAQMTADFIDATIEVLAQIQRLSNMRSMFSAFNASTIRHLGATVNFNTWLAEGDRVHPYFQQGGYAGLTPTNVFPPETELGTFAVSGPGAGTITAGDTVDTTRYGGAQLALVATSAIGSENIGVTLTVTDEDGEEDEVSGTITALSESATVVELGTSADRFVAVTACEITGGTASDAFKIVTLEDRELGA